MARVEVRAGANWLGVVLAARQPSLCRHTWIVGDADVLW